MRYFKIVENGYIICIGQGNTGTEISKTMYNKIFRIIQNKPVPPEGKDYKLRDKDLEWEEYTPEPEPEPEKILNGDEASREIFGTSEFTEKEIITLKKLISDAGIDEKKWKGGEK